MTETKTWKVHQHLEEVSLQLGIRYAGAEYDPEHRVTQLTLPAGRAVEDCFTEISRRAQARIEAGRQPRAPQLAADTRQALRVLLPEATATVELTVAAVSPQVAIGIVTDLLPLGTAIGHGHSAGLELTPGAPEGPLHGVPGSGSDA